MRRQPRRPALPVVLAALVALGFVATACSTPGDDRTDDAGAAAVTTEATSTLLIMGSAASIGDQLDEPLQDSWPRVFYREAFPRATVLVNAAGRSSTVLDAQRDQLPLAQELRPDVVAIWLGQADLVIGTPVALFETELATLVQRVRETGARVLLANLTAHGASAARTAAFNDAVADVARAQDATLVDLFHTRISTLATVNDTFAPDVAGHRAIARAFTDALKG
jgi:lysophospholipase L1-like esterase